MLSILSPITSVFSLIGLGYLLTRTRVFGKTANEGLTRFVFYVAIPALLFGSIVRNSAASGNEIAVAIAYFLAAITFFMASLVFARLVLRAGLAAGAVFAMNTTFGNTVMLGVPLLLQVHGERAAGAVFSIVGFHSLTLMPLAIALIELGMGGRASLPRAIGRTLLAVIRNPVIVSLAAGFAWSAVGLSLPGPIDQVIRMLGAAAGPCALFALGASLAGYRVTADLPEALIVTMFKLLGLPVFVWVTGAVIFHLPPLELQVATTMAALPTGANAFILAANYRMFERSSAATVVISTGLSYLTLFGLLTLFALGDR